MDVVDEAVALLSAGEAIVYPTDTVYGLGVDALNEKAIDRIFMIKGRDKTIAISVAVCSLGMAKKFVELDDFAEKLFLRCMPGPLTMVVKNRGLPEILTGGTGTIGIRMPDDGIALGIITGLGRPVTATSANRHGKPPARSVGEARAQLGDEIALYVDGGARSGESSTVYDCLSRRVIRQGSLRIENYL